MPVSKLDGKMNILEEENWFFAINIF